MGTLHNGNGGEGGGGLPELPPEWGALRIPDDPSALSEEAAIIRRRLRRYDRSRRLRRRLHLAPPPPRRYHDDHGSGVGTPLIVMAIAVITALVSLFAIGWPGPRRAGTANRPGSPDAANRTSAAPAPLASLTLADSSGARIRLTDTLPAVVLLVDDCACEDLITSTAAAAGAGITVLAVATAWVTPVPVLMPGDPARSGRIYRLVDPDRSVRSSINGLTSPQGAAAALIGRDGTAIRVLPEAASVEDFRADLGRLTR
ncbi:MAG TPA: hypothetical protein VK453_09065 [Micromonosporaceae bacterium]|nr:hypothetical protein [Micromonosporaceae bacterium]